LDPPQIPIGRPEKDNSLTLEMVRCEPLFRMAERVSPRKVRQGRAFGAHLTNLSL
jgi:hypothetical protein